ncbi:MAG: hypothetical protein ACOCWY_00150 [Thermodesulfobacteriota bacterium]
MEQGKIAKQMLSYQKSLFESSFNAVCAVQDQTEQMTKTFIEQMPWMPEEGKQTLKQSMDTYKKARDNFKKSVEDGYAQLEKLFEGK